jgi:hypothetical protein
MFSLVTYEMIRQMNEERRAKSLQKFWWRHVDQSPHPVAVPTTADAAEVIELVFGAHCEAEESIGA